MAQPLKPAGKGDGKAVGASEAVAAEVKVPENLESSTNHAMLSQAYPNITVEKAVYYQLDNYPGFVHAFMSSIRYGPVRHQHDRWRIVGERLTQEKKKALIVLGANDPIIIQNEVMEDARSVLGAGNVEFEVFEAGHEVPITKGREVARKIAEFWERTE